MLNRVCLGTAIVSFFGVIIEGLVLEQNITSFTIIVVTCTIMILAIIIFEAVNHIKKRLRI